MTVARGALQYSELSACLKTKIVSDREYIRSDAQSTLRAPPELPPGAPTDPFAQIVAASAPASTLPPIDGASSAAGGGGGGGASAEPPLPPPVPIPRPPPRREQMLQLPSPRSPRVVSDVEWFHLSRDSLPPSPRDLVVGDGSGGAARPPYQPPPPQPPQPPPPPQPLLMMPSAPAPPRDAAAASCHFPMPAATAAPPLSAEGSPSPGGPLRGGGAMLIGGAGGSVARKGRAFPRRVGGAPRPWLYGQNPDAARLVLTSAEATRREVASVERRVEERYGGGGAGVMGSDRLPLKPVA